jgi:hypothetical protein
MKLLKFSTAAILAISLLFTSCEEFGFYISGEGDIVSETIELSDFTAISATGAFDVVISQGDTIEVIATGHQNIIDRLKRDVANNSWNISLELGNYHNYELTVYITMPDIEAIKTTGSGDVYVNDFYNGGDLEMRITGSGDIEMNRFENCPKLTADITGSGDIELKDEFPELEIIDLGITGSGNVNAYPATAAEAYIAITGSGSCYVTATDYLDVHISGSGNVNYKGTPEVDVKVTGSGSVYSKN